MLEQITYYLVYYAMQFPYNRHLQNSPMFHGENSGPHKHSWDSSKQRGSGEGVAKKNIAEV